MKRIYFFLFFFLVLIGLFCTKNVYPSTINPKNFIHNNLKGIIKLIAGLGSIGFGTILIWRSKFKSIPPIIAGTVFIISGYITSINGVDQIVEQYSYQKKIAKDLKEHPQKIKTESFA